MITGKIVFAIQADKYRDKLMGNDFALVSNVLLVNE